MTNNQTLTESQALLLKIIYKYRFVTSNQIANIMDLSVQFSRRQLALLTSNGLIIRKYDASYRLNGKPAVFYLTTLGLRALGLPNLASQELRRIRSASKLSDSFVEKCLKILDIFIEIKKVATEDLSVLNSLDLRSLELFPENPPDLLIRSKSTKFPTIALYYLAQIPQFVIQREIDQLVEYYESSEWQETLQETFPWIVIVCASEQQRTSIVRFKNRLLEDLEIDQLKIVVLGPKTKVNDWLIF